MFLFVLYYFIATNTHCRVVTYSNLERNLRRLKDYKALGDHYLDPHDPLYDLKGRLRQTIETLTHNALQEDAPGQVVGMRLNSRGRSAS